MESLIWTLIYWTFITGVIVLFMFIIYRIVRSYERKNRIQFWVGIIFFGGIIVLILFVNELIPGSSVYYDYRYSKRVTGRAMVLKDVYTYESYREPLLGDGYSMYIYKFDDESAKYFNNPDKTFFTDYPFDLSEETKWLKVNWTECPIFQADSNFRSFALNESQQFSASLVTTLDKAEGLIGKLLEEERNYYAYSAKVLSFDEGYEGVWNISFYVLSPKKKWLVAIYSDM